MKSSSLQLDDFFVTHLDLRWVEGTEDKQPQDCMPEMDFTIAKHNEKATMFRLTLRVALPVKKGRTGLNIDSEIAGFFSFPPQTEDEDMQYLVRINGATILYGILRGQIAMASGSFPPGKFLLPAVVMPDVWATFDHSRKAKGNEIAEESLNYNADAEDR